jgi:hypothetical protein
MRIDGSLARGFVRSETRAMNGAVQEHIRGLFDTLKTGVVSPFQNGSRLSFSDMSVLAADLDTRAKATLSSTWSDLSVKAPTKGRPQSGSFDLRHYWIRPQRIEDTSDRDMRLSVLTATVDRKKVLFQAHDTPVRFYEHAARRFLQRADSEPEAIHRIAERLCETFILPFLAVCAAPAGLAGTAFAIPFHGGLLLGAFEKRPAMVEAIGASRLFDVNHPAGLEKPVGLMTRVELVIRTYVGASEIRTEQKWQARQIEDWLLAHAQEASLLRRYAYHPSDGTRAGALKQDAFQALVTSFLTMRETVFGPLPVRKNTAGPVQSRPAAKPATYGASASPRAMMAGDAAKAPVRIISGSRLLALSKKSPRKS